ncbi:MAG TPA: hypothetical protein VIR79_01120 [Nitrospira sp.]
MRAIDENADQVYYKYRITAPHPENQKLVEHLFVVPPTVVAQALDLLADWDLVPAPAERHFRRRIEDTDLPLYRRRAQCQRRRLRGKIAGQRNRGRPGK